MYKPLQLTTLMLVQSVAGTPITDEQFDAPSKRPIKHRRPSGWRSYEHMIGDEKKQFLRLTGYKIR